MLSFGKSFFVPTLTSCLSIDNRPILGAIGGDDGVDHSPRWLELYL